MKVEQRLHRLERQVRWMRRVGILGAVLVAVAVLIGQGKPRELPDLVAKSLTLKDEQGRTRLQLGASKKFEELGAYGLFILSEDGNVQAAVWTTGNGGWSRVDVSTEAETGAQASAVLMVTDEDAWLSLDGPESPENIYLQSKRGEGAYLELVVDGVNDDEYLARLGIDAAKGLPFLVFRDRDGKVSWRAPTQK